jgi:outer membrane protein insertion porin family
MVRRYFSIVIAVIVTALVVPRVATAQSRFQSPRCLPNSATAIGRSNVRHSTTEGKRYFVDELRFEGDTKLSESELKKVAAELNPDGPIKPLPKFEEPGIPSDRRDEIAEMARSSWQDRGYFRAEITATGEQLSHDPTSEHYAVILHVSAGRQYRVGVIQLEKVDGGQSAIPVDELRKLIPLQQGDVFDTSKLRAAFDAIKRRYGQSGYIDSSIVPDFEINDVDGVINLTLKFDEQKQFRVTRVETLGLDTALQSELRSAVPLGEPFNYDRVLEFIEANRSRLPQGVGPADINVDRYWKDATVSLTFDFQSCPQTTNR